MARDELLTLAERVEAATGADRELDKAVAAAAGFRDIYGDGSLWDRGNEGYWMLDTDNANQLLPMFTASLDAAMTLVPSGCEWSVNWCGNSVANVNRIDVDYPVHCGHAATPALALTAAALRAIAAQNDASTTREHANAGE